MRMYDDIQLDFPDVLLRPKRSTVISRSDADLTRVYSFLHSNVQVSGTGIINANMGTVGVFEIAKKMLGKNLFSCLHKHYNYEQVEEFLSSVNPEQKPSVFLSIGLRERDIDIAKRAIAYDPKVSICIDVPNGYIPPVKKLVVTLREMGYEGPLMVGNVVTGDITEDLILSGASIVKVGIGPGSACLTRRITGVGRPQLSAVIECAEAAHCVGGMVCADGGITCPGDVCKALGAGADFVMIGGYYAGASEADGEVIEKNGKKYKIFYGMSSEYAQKKFYNGMPKYRASEGRLVEVPYKGSIDDINDEILGGIRSCMGYIGARRLKDIPKFASFYRVNRQLNTVFEG
ncbi:MAG: GMP reductase [Holosporales bacterium]|jgi:GMP reductase|nr:GMP reductase [Holosporales bacterium]